MAGVQAHTARLIALFVSCVLYGILLTTLVSCLRSLLLSHGHTLRFKPRHEMKFPIIAATVLMFLVSTFSAVLAMQDIIDAFINYTGPGGALEYYNILNVGWKHWFLAVEDAIQVVLGDGLLIYRCYVIYDRSWRAVVVPMVVWIATTALSLTSAYKESALVWEERLDDSGMMPFLSATLLLTFATSIITTYLIVSRLVRVNRLTRVHGAIQPHFLSRVAVIFFETGLIYTLSLIASLCVYLSGSNLEYVASLALIHIIPITCNLLLIRVEGITRATPPAKGFRTSTDVAVSGGEKYNPQAEDEV